MTLMPFLCLGLGFLFSIKPLSLRVLKIVDSVINVALILLMLTIGMNIGVNDTVMLNLSVIGFKCLVISILAITFSVFFVFIVEKTVLPLDSCTKSLNEQNLSISKEVNIDNTNKEISPIIFIMPISIILGIIIGYFLLSSKYSFILDYSLIVSLVILYTGVGISLGSNRKVFRYVKLIGFKVIYIPAAILVGSLLGGTIAGFILNVPLHISIVSASGMSYYSITGAYMTQVFGIEAGTYGFVVNVMREFLTVLLLPILIKISKGSPIAGGAAGNMDTMLVPVTKFVGAELGLVALITGVILTFLVPLIIPILCNTL